MTDVDKKTGYFKIIYEDGDNEELQGDELLKLLGKMSKQALNFIKSSVKMDPVARLTAAEALLHPYFEKYAALD